MNLKTLSTALTLLILISTKTGFGQELDTLCLPTSQVKFLAASTEKYYLCDSLTKVQDEIIQEMEILLIEKQEQIQLGENLFHGFRDEVKRLKRQRVFLGVGLGVSLTALLLVLL